MRRYKLEVRGREFTIDVQELAADEFEVVVDGETYDVTLATDEDLPVATIHPAFVPSGNAAAAARPAAPAAPTATAADPTVAAVGPSATPTAMAPTTAPAAPPIAVRPRAAPAGARKAATGSAALNAPMPGVIIEICVQAGDVVARGQEVAVLDAMKMHNSIKSPRAGTIREVCVTQGHAVGHGDPIIRYEDG